MKINIKKLTLANLGSLSNSTISISKYPTYNSILENNPLLDRLQTQYSYFFDSFEKKTYSGLGVELRNLDKKVDKTLNGFKKLIKGYAEQPVASTAKGAELLLATMKQIGLSISVVSYGSQIEYIDKLISEYSKPANKSYIMGLGLTLVFDNLKSIQEEFKMLFLVQVKENAKLREIPSASNIRPQLEDALESFFNLVRSMKAIPVWENLYMDLNQLIKSYQPQSKSKKPKIVTSEVGAENKNDFE